MNKAEAVLLLYDQFKDNHYLSKADYLSLTGIKDLTFRRYIAELRCYLMEWRPYEEIVYKKNENRYYLVQNK
jgi:hypothetical protein